MSMKKDFLETLCTVEQMTKEDATATTEVKNSILEMVEDFRTKLQEDDSDLAICVMAALAQATISRLSTKQSGIFESGGYSRVVPVSQIYPRKSEQSDFSRFQTVSLDDIRNTRGTSFTEKLTLEQIKAKYGDLCMPEIAAIEQHLKHGKP